MPTKPVSTHQERIASKYIGSQSHFILAHSRNSSIRNLPGWTGWLRKLPWWTGFFLDEPFSKTFSQVRRFGLRSAYVGGIFKWAYTQSATSRENAGYLYSCGKDRVRDCASCALEHLSQNEFYPSWARYRESGNEPLRNFSVVSYRSYWIIVYASRLMATV